MRLYNKEGNYLLAGRLAWEISTPPITIWAFQPPMAKYWKRWDTLGHPIPPMANIYCTT
jgi:hypothetical protein